MAPLIECSTEDKLEYTFYPVNGGIVNFKVRAPNDAHLALTSGPGESDPMLEVYIGGWKNTKSIIRKNRTKPDVAENDTPDVLDAGEFRGFWIRWLDDVVTVGKEGEAAAFLSYQMDEPFPIAFVGVCTGWGACGSWIIEDEEEIETTDNLQYNFRALDRGEVTFYFKGPSNCHLALLPINREVKPICELILGGWNNNESAIRHNHCKPDKVHVETPNICNPNDFTKFYCCWNKGNVCVRRGGPNGQLIMQAHDCIQFGVLFVGIRTAWGATGQWKLAFGPQSMKLFTPGQGPAALTQGPSDSPVASAPASCFGGGPACWVAAQAGELPSNAIEAGMDGEPLYIGRAKHEGALIPGKIVPSHGCCYIAWGGGEHAHPEYEALCEGPGQWLAGTGTDIPGHAFPAGETEDGEPLFIGRATHEGTLTIGKIQPSHGVCYIPYGGQEMAFSDFEIFCTL